MEESTSKENQEKSVLEDAEQIKVPKLERKESKRGAKLLRRFSEETAHALSRLTKSDSSLMIRRSRWKMVKNSLIFIKGTKEIIEKKALFAYSDNFHIDEILTADMKQEICKILGPEVDLYLYGLRFRDFDRPSTPL